MNGRDVAIAGGGIIGLTTAMELAAAGCKVTVFDQAEAMSEASRAAAGMLAATDPENPPELQDLARFSLSLYPEFLARVESLSAARVPIRTTRTLQGAEHLPAAAVALTEDEVQTLAPGANTADWKFFLLEEESFDAWDLAEALPKAVRAAGIELREHTPVLRIRSDNGGVQIETAAGSFSVGAFVNATGAWAPALDPAVPVTPRKGHMLTAELTLETPMHCVLRTPRVYIVPRGHHRYTIGPTVEDVGFDRNVHPEHIQALYNKAAELWPRLRVGRIAETWVGHRPASEDGLPVIDETGPNCWIATGHFKNGIMLGPGTGRALSQWITGAAPEVDLSPFRISRFATSTVLP